MISNASKLKLRARSLSRRHFVENLMENGKNELAIVLNYVGIHGCYELICESLGGHLGHRCNRESPFCKHCASQTLLQVRKSTTESLCSAAYQSRTATRLFIFSSKIYLDLKKIWNTLLQ